MSVPLHYRADTARPLGIEYECALYHVTSRGNTRQDIFIDGGDRRDFLEGLVDARG